MIKSEPEEDPNVSGGSHPNPGSYNERKGLGKRLQPILETEKKEIFTLTKRRTYLVTSVDPIYGFDLLKSHDISLL